ncbi:MAG: MarR family transcriptional regulator, partial [Ignavibacteriaceae bacterium]|nr:MarR family transcriptional regulator [Ignavibacteriaceae bacterium]
MKLEVEIKQKSFRNEYHKLAVNIIFTHGWLQNINAIFLKKYDLTSQQFNILRILRGQHPHPASINLLKDRMLDKMSDVSRLVERLRVKGLLHRTICNNDRRKSDVEITAGGLNLLNDIDAFENEFDDL